MRYLITPLLVFAGSLMLSSTAIAQTIDDTSTTSTDATATTDVLFNGEVPHICEFSNGTSDSVVLAGTLVPIGSPIVTRLSSKEPGASSAEVDVLCNGTSDLNVEAPMQTGGPVVEANTESSVASSIGNIDSSGSSLEIPPGEVIALAVDMEAEAVDTLRGFAPGNYQYKVTLTVSPR